MKQHRRQIGFPSVEQMSAEFDPRASNKLNRNCLVDRSQLSSDTTEPVEVRSRQLTVMA